MVVFDDLKRFNGVDDHHQFISSHIMRPDSKLAGNFTGERWSYAQSLGPVRKWLHSDGW